jgi:hypothetical protein
MTPENTACTVAQAGESTPENVELSANYAPPLGAAPRKPLDPGIECDPRIGR